MAARTPGRAIPAATLCAVLLSALWLGGNRPAAWMLLSGAVLVLFTLQTAADRRDPDALRLWRRLWPAAALYLAVLGWAAIQALPGASPGLAHPAWAIAPGAEHAISADPWAGWQVLLRLTAYGGVFWIAARAGQRGTGLAGLLMATGLFGALLALYGLLAQGSGVNPLTGPSAYPGAVTASFVNRNAYAFYAGLGAMATIAAIRVRLSTGHGPGWGVLTLALPVLATALLLTGSRAGLIAALTGALLAAALGTLPRHGALAAAGAAALAAAISLAAVLPRLGADTVTGNERFRLYALITDGIGDQPLAGHGLGAFQDAFRAYLPTAFSGAEWDLAHNTYLENAFELGLPAAFALLAAAALLARHLTAGLCARRRHRALPALGLAIGVAAALHAALDFSLQMPATAALAAYLAGLAAGASLPPGPRQLT